MTPEERRNKELLSRLWKPRRYRIKEMSVYYYGLVVWGKAYVETIGKN